MESFGETFKKARNSISQIYVAEKLGVTQSYISQIECGSKRPSLDFVDRANKELGFNLMDINIESEIELLIQISKKIKPIDLKKIVRYAQKIEKAAENE